MTPRSFLRKIMAVLRGGTSPIMIVLSVALGFCFGLTPSWSGIHTAILVVVLILNVHLGIFLVFAGLGKALCLAAAPLMFHLGIWVHHYLSGFLGLLAHIPLIAITDFNRYSVAAAVVIGPVVGIICGLLLARAVAAFRHTWLRLEDGSERFKKWRSKRWIRLLDRLLVGKSVKDVRQVLTGKGKIVRKAGVALAILLIALSVVGISLVKDNRVKEHAARAMTKANGAEVNLEELKLRILSGRVSASGIQLTDPEEPQNNRLAIRHLTADASVYALLLGNVVLENIELTDLQVGQKRTTPGKVEKAEPASEPVFDREEFEIGDAEVNKLLRYFKNARALKDWLQKARQYLPAGKEKKDTGPVEVPPHYLDYLTARAPTSAAPRILAKQITLDQIELPWDPIGNSTIRLTNISDAPEAAALPVTIDIQSHETASTIRITNHYEAPEPEAEITGTLADIDLEELQSEMSDKSSVVFKAGKASGKLSGTANRETVNLTIAVKVHDFQARSKGTGLFGLDPKITAEALKVLKNIETKLTLVGPLVEPRLIFDADHLRESLQAAVIQAGKDKLTEELDKQIGTQLQKLGEKLH